MTINPDYYKPPVLKDFLLKIISIRMKDIMIINNSLANTINMNIYYIKKLDPQQHGTGVIEKQIF